MLNYLIVLDNEKEFEIEKGKNGIIQVENKDDDYKYILSSSIKSMAIFNYTFIPNIFENIFFLNDEFSCDIYFNTTKDKAKFIYYIYDKKTYYKITNLQIYQNYSDSLFKKTNSFSNDYFYYINYYFGLEEQYYLYIKKFLEIWIFTNIPKN